MEIVQRHVLRRKDGAYMNIWFEPVKSFSRAVRLDEDGFHTLMTGRFKPDNPEDYYLQPIQITYEVIENERDDEPVSEN